MTFRALTAEDVFALARVIEAAGFDDLTWAQSLGPPTSAEAFVTELAFVICNSGMKNEIARAIFERVRGAIEAGESATTVFGHEGKARAIDELWRNRETYFRLYNLAADKHAYLLGLPWIGSITVMHAMRNFGAEVAKPDVHLARLARLHGMIAQDLCKRLAEETGLRIGTIDTLLWRACATGLIDSRTGELHIESNA